MLTEAFPSCTVIGKVTVIRASDTDGAGVIPCSNLLPEVAYTKLMWILSQTDDLKQIRSLINMNIAGEILDREGYNGFIVLQGVEKGVEDVLKNI